MEEQKVQELVDGEFEDTEDLEDEDLDELDEEDGEEDTEDACGEACEGEEEGIAVSVQDIARFANFTDLTDKCPDALYPRGEWYAQTYNDLLSIFAECTVHMNIIDEMFTAEEYSSWSEEERLENLEKYIVVNQVIANHNTVVLWLEFPLWKLDYTIPGTEIESDLLEDALVMYTNKVDRQFHWKLEPFELANKAQAVVNGNEEVYSYHALLHFSKQSFAKVSNKKKRNKRR